MLIFYITLFFFKFTHFYSKNSHTDSKLGVTTSKITKNAGYNFYYVDVPYAKNIFIF